MTNSTPTPAAPAYPLETICKNCAYSFGMHNKFDQSCFGRAGYKFEPTAPLTPEPPKCCPVCLETLVDRASVAFITFVCRQVMYLDEGGDWKPQTSWECVCERAQQVAIALRQKLADEKTANECLQDELTVLRAERDAPLARAEKAEALNKTLELNAAEIDRSRCRVMAELEKLEKERDEIKSNAYVWAGSNPFTGEQVLQLLNENDAARARLAELTEAGIKFHNAHDWDTETNEYFHVDPQAAHVFYAALASGAESEVTK